MECSYKFCSFNLVFHLPIPSRQTQLKWRIISLGAGLCNLRFNLINLTRNPPLLSQYFKRVTLLHQGLIFLFL